MPELTVAMIEGDIHHYNGKLSIRAVATVDGKQVSVERLTIDSQPCRIKTAKNWAAAFGLDRDEVMRQLDALSVKAMVAAQEQQKRRSENAEKRRAAIARSDRITALAERVIRGKDPTYRRQDTHIYFNAVGREVGVAKVWTLATDTELEAVDHTQEGQRASRDGMGLVYDKRVGLWKHAVSIALPRVLADLPEWKTIQEDPTVDAEVLIADLRHWLMAARSARPDNANPVTFTFYSWAYGIEPGPRWLQCFHFQVFGRLDDRRGVPKIAVRGEILRADLKHPHPTKLGAELQAAGFVELDYPLKVAGRTVKAWLIADHVVGELASADSSEVTEGPHES